MPFFSILLPTKNRSHIVNYAIQSILNQTHQCFEIILVDNDDSDATAKAIKVFNDSRIRYFRTGNLNMVENWSFALQQAKGQFITVLEDKQAYYPHALATLKATIQAHDAQVFVWNWDVFNDHIKMAYQASKVEDICIKSSHDILRSYVQHRPEVWAELPRLLNSCVSAKLVKKIEQHPQVEQFFSLLSPDLCAAFYQLGSVDEICLLRQPLGLVGYFQLSNAAQSLKKKKNIFEFFGKGNYINVVVSHVPIKETKLLNNSIYNDYLRVREKVGGKLKKHVMTPKTYANMCLSDFVRMSYDKDNVQTFQDILKHMKQHQVPRFWPVLRCVQLYIVRKLGERPYLTQWRDRLKSKTWKAENILEASEKRP